MPRIAVAKVMPFFELTNFWASFLQKNILDALLWGIHDRKKNASDVKNGKKTSFHFQKAK